jgi:hypothetical protein
MKKPRIFLIITIVLITIPLVVSPAMATATRTEWTEQETACELYCPAGEECFRYADGITQVRGLVRTERVLRFDPVTLERYPEWDGWSYVIVNWDFNEYTGNGNSWGTFTRVYDEKDGTFVGTWNGPIRDGHFTGWVVGKGTGDFEGQILKGWLNNVPVKELPLKRPCKSADVWGEVNHGYILDATGE